MTGKRQRGASVLRRLASISGARRFRFDGRGTTAVEFGLIAAPFMLSLFAVFEIGYNFYLVSVIDHATQEAGRAIMTGAVSSSGASLSTFKTQYVCPNLPSVISCSNVFVNVAPVPQGQSPSGYYNFVNAAKSGLVQPPLSDSQSTFCPGAGQSYIVLQVSYPAPYFTGFFSAGATTTYNGQKVHVVTAATTFVSEPYAGEATYAGC